MANIFPSIKYNVWHTPRGAAYPPIIEEGNTAGWYLSDKPATITKDGSDRVSEWADFLGSGHDLLQATGADQPLWSINGLLFEGITQFMNAAFAYNQPHQIYIVFRQISWLINDRIFDGLTANTGNMYQGGVTPELVLYNGISSPVNNNLILNTFGIVRALFNGASSSFQINETAEWTGALSAATNMGGFTLGEQGGGSRSSNIEVKEVILRNIADTAPNNQLIYDYLANKHSI